MWGGKRVQNFKYRGRERKGEGKERRGGGKVEEGKGKWKGRDREGRELEEGKRRKGEEVVGKGGKGKGSEMEEEEGRKGEEEKGMEGKGKKGTGEEGRRWHYRGWLTQGLKYEVPPENEKEAPYLSHALQIFLGHPLKERRLKEHAGFCLTGPSLLEDLLENFSGNFTETEVQRSLDSQEGAAACQRTKRQ